MRRRVRNHEVRSFVGPELHARVWAEAAARRQSVSRTVRDALSTYFVMIDEASTAIGGAATDSSTDGRRVAHRLLADTEERLAATIDRQAELFARALGRLDLIAAMVDQLYLGMMIHLPDVTTDLRAAAVASGERRHLLWRRAVAQLLREGGATLAEPAYRARASDGRSPSKLSTPLNEDAHDHDHQRE